MNTPETNQKLWHIVDASGYIFRAYHALPPMNATDGTPVNAVYGFCSMMLKLLQDMQAERLLIVFDSGRQTFRQKIYTEYKAHRPDAPDDLIPQFPLIRQAVEAMGLIAIESTGFEADDIIATLATQISNTGDKVCIVSSDKDLMQLINDNIYLLDPIKNKNINREQVFEKFGVYPEMVIDVQSLAGDSSDNIPGISGIGIKTAAELINQFGSLEKLLQNAQAITQNKRRERIIDGAEMARISKQLVTLRHDTPLPDTANNLIHNINYDSFFVFLQKLGFKSLVNRINLSNATSSTININYHVINNDEKISKCTDKIFEHGICAIASNDIGIELCCENDQVFFIKNELINNTLIAVLNDKNITYIGHNIKKDMHRLWQYGIRLNAPHDTMALCYTVGMHNYDVKTAAAHYLDNNFTGQNGEEISLILKLFSLLYQKVASAKLMQVYETIDRHLIPILFKMEQAGICVDKNVLATLSHDFGIQITDLQHRIYQHAGQSFNIASPKQMAEVLFDKLKLPHSKKNSKSGAFSTNSDVLEDLAGQGHTIATEILAWRQYAKLKNTYTDALPPLINQHTGRIHTTFSATTTATGRLSSTDPNLQNIPIRSVEGQKIRTAFHAKDGHVLVCCDYSQIELRLLAHLAEVEALQNAFRNCDDIHRITAHHVFDIPLSLITKEMRYRAKAINFGIIYGITAFGLAKQLGCSKAEAKNIIDTYFNRYNGIQTYMDSVLENARKNNSITTIFKRVCPISGLNDSNPARRAFAERAAMNAPLQGSAADLIKIAMIKVDRFLQNHQTKLLLQVHDELIFEVPISEQETIIKPIINIMETAHLPEYPLSVPIVVDYKVGYRWG